MGMYTEIVYAAELKQNPPQQVVDVLHYMTTGDGEVPAELLPDHPLFSCHRWAHMLRSDSYYFRGTSHSTFVLDGTSHRWELTVRSNLKNYHGEIEVFIDWLTPCIDAQDGDFLGYTRYENDDDPTLIYHPNELRPLAAFKEVSRDPE